MESYDKDIKSVESIDFNNNTENNDFPVIKDSDFSSLWNFHGKCLNQKPTIADSDSDTELNLNKNSRILKKLSFKSSSSSSSNLFIASENSNSNNSHFSYDSEEPLSNIYKKLNYKWCVCSEGSKATGDSKMCQKCDQWYHLKCLSYSPKAIEQFMSKNNEQTFICPVCFDDEEFITKHKITIEYRNRNYSKLIVLDTESSDSDRTEHYAPKILSDIENHQPLSSDENPMSISVKPKQDTHSSDKKASSIEIISRKEVKKLTPPTVLGAKKIIVTPKSSFKMDITPKPVAPKTPAVNYTANSSGQPIDARKNLQCMQCKQLLKDNISAPKKIRHDYKDSKSLKENWQYSIYCDEKCLREYIETELKKSEYNGVKVIELLDSITKRRQKNICIETVDFLSLDTLKKRVFDFLAVYPKYFIMNASYKAEFGLKEQKLTPSLSHKIQLESKKAPLNASNLKKQTSHTKLSERVSDSSSATSSLQTTSAAASKQQPLTSKLLSSSKNTTTPLSNKQAEPGTSNLSPERANFKRQLIVILTDRYNNMADKTGLESLNINHLAEEIESANYMYFREAKLKYKTRLISIIMNLKSITNNTFYVNVLTGKLTPEQLPKIAVEEMADEKLNNERMKQRMEDLTNKKKFSDELNIEKTKPHIKKTNKGEMYVETERITFTEALSQANILIEQSPVKKIAPPVQITSNEIFESISKPLKIKDITPIKIPEPSPSFEFNCEIKSKLTDQDIIPISPIKLQEEIYEVNYSSKVSDPETIPISPMNYEVNYSTKDPTSSFDLFPFEARPSYLPPKSPEIEPQSPISDKSLLNTSEVQQFSPDVPVLKNSALAKLQLKSKVFWQGEIEAQDGYVVSVNTEMIPNTSCVELVEQIKSASFEKMLKVNGQYSITNRHTSINFWSYLENIKEYLNAKLVFFNVNSNGTKNSKLFVPNKPEPIMMDDNDMSSLFFGHMLKNEKIFEYKVPTSLKDLIGYIYIVPLKNKHLNEDCPRMKRKFAISMPRNKDQLVGIMVDCKTTKIYNLPADFSHFVQNETFEKFVQIAEMEKHIRRTKEESITKEIPISLEAYKLKAAQRTKRKSSDSDLLKNENSTKCPKTRNSFGNGLESDDLISPVNIQPVLTASACITQSRDPRLKESRDPRLKAKSNSAALNDKASDVNKLEAKSEESIKFGNKTETGLLDSEIQTFSTKCQLKQITPKEAEIWVNKFLTSNECNKPQKTIIINSLQLLLSETINQTSSVDSTIAKSPVEEPVKPKRVSRFSDGPPNLYSEANPDANFEPDEPTSTTSFSRNVIIQNKKSEAYYALYNLILELKENGYDMNLQQNLPNLLNDILKKNSTGANRLTQNELSLIKIDHGHLFPHVIKMIENDFLVDSNVVDPNNNNISN